MSHIADTGAAGRTTWKVFVSGADHDGPLAYIYGGVETATEDAARVWVRDHLPELAAQAPAGIRVTALLQQGTYTTQGFRGGRNTYVSRTVWTAHRTPSCIAHLNSTGDVIFQARTPSA
jgi:hypothetical protein